MPEYKSNIQTEVQSIIVDLKKVSNPTAISRVGANRLIIDMIRRIHTEGKSANGGAIGQYSSKPMYVSVSAFVRKKGKVGKSSTGKPIKGQRTLAPKGKYNDGAKFKNGKPRKSRYFEDGYVEYHDEMGEGSKVNLTLTRQLQNDLLVSPAGKNFGLSFSEYGMKIYPGLENHFSVVIWMASEKEKTSVVRAIEDWIDEQLKI